MPPACLPGRTTKTRNENQQERRCHSKRSNPVTMRLSLAVVTSILGFSQAFVLAPASQCASSTTTQLAAAPLDRRDALAKGAVLLSAAFVAAPTPVFAKEYTPKFDDLKQIYFLGTSLDRLVAKLSDPDTVESGLEGVRTFNKDPNFYTGYARNYVLKMIDKGGDSDPRTGYIRQASTLVGSIEALLDGSFDDKGTTADAIKRVKKAQGLIGKFLAESGVKDEKIDVYIKSH